MNNFLENIFAQLDCGADRVVMREVHGQEFVGLTGRELRTRIVQIRTFARHAGLKPGDRCALLAPNSILWAAFDVALMAEGVVVVPLYSRQSPSELSAMLKDCEPSILFSSDLALAQAVIQGWSDAPRCVLFEEALEVTPTQVEDSPVPRSDGDLVTIIYTSGTSGEAKGVCLNVGNINHMLRCTGERLDQLMGYSQTSEPDRVFHYLPFNFAGSWILLLSCLSRVSELTLSP